MKLSWVFPRPASDHVREPLLVHYGLHIDAVVFLAVDVLSPDAAGWYLNPDMCAVDQANHARKAVLSVAVLLDLLFRKSGPNFPFSLRVLLRPDAHSGTRL